MVDNHSYVLSEVTVCMYDGLRYPSVSKRSRITDIEDIGHVVKADVENEIFDVNGEKLTITSADAFVNCIICSGKTQQE